MFEFLPKGLYIDFLRLRRFNAYLSWILTAASVAVFFLIGPNWSIDFTGGTEVEMQFAKPTDVSEVRAALKPLGISDDSIQTIDDPSKNQFLIRTTGDAAANPEDVEAVRTALVRTFGDSFLAEGGFSPDAQVGTRITVEYNGDPRPTDEIVASLAGLKDVTVQMSAGENTFYVRLPGLAEGIRDTLEKSLDDRGAEVLRTETVGPKVGASLRTAGILSLGITMLLLLVYIGFRFDFTFAPGAIACLFHDSTIVIGFWVVTQQEFGLTLISALLTLLGYSINDTIIVYDRIRENMERYRSNDLSRLINDSLNQTLSRTILTGGTTALSMLPFLIWGGPVLGQFAEAMLFGIIVGTYSSIYVAAPLTIILREYREPMLRVLGLAPKATPSPIGGPPGPGRRPGP